MRAKKFGRIFASPNFANSHLVPHMKMEQVNQNLLFRTHLLPDSTRDKPLLFTSQTLFYLLFSLFSPQSPSSSSFLHPSSHFHLLPSRTEESTSTRNPVPSIHLPRLKRIFRKYNFFVSLPLLLYDPI